MESFPRGIRGDGSPREESGGFGGGPTPGPALITIDIRSTKSRGLAVASKPPARPRRIVIMSMSGRDGRRTGLGAIAGLLAAGTALGVGQFVAGLTGASGSPVVAVGELQIDFTPPWLKNFAINQFSAADKLLPLTGILGVIAIFAAVIGAAAPRRMAYGMAGLAVFRGGGPPAPATQPTAALATPQPG